MADAIAMLSEPSFGGYVTGGIIFGILPCRLLWWGGRKALDAIGIV